MDRGHYGKTGVLNVQRIVASMFTTIASPYAIERLKALERGEYGSNAPDPRAYADAQSFAYDYACHTALKKLRVSSDIARLTQEAVDRFKTIESDLLVVNRTLRSGATNVEGLLSVARRKIAQILGPVSHREWLDACGWGPGATSSITAAGATVDQKVLEPRLSVTRAAAFWASCEIHRSPIWLSARIGTPIDGPISLLDPFEFVDSSRWTTVDKDYKSRRAIDIQPTMNLFLQKGVGSCIRRRLRRIGVDLDDQSRNQELAKSAFTSGYATIDLANASDSISYELVRTLLPPDWFEVLNDLRTKFTRIDSSLHYLQKFSSMGNGYTFELESLLFYALCWAVVRVEGDDAETPIGIYGDDIIVGQEHASRLIEVLNAIGFSVNTDKTFVSGNFYESCGKHFFKGQDVTPFYQKEEIVDVPSAIRAANRIYRWAERIGGGFGLDDVAYPAWSLAVSIAGHLHGQWVRRTRLSALKRGKRPMPVSYYALPTQPFWVEGDSGLLGIDESLTCKGWRFVPTSRSGDPYALLSESLRRDSMTERPSYGLVSPRGQGKYCYQSMKYRQVVGRGHGWLRLRLESQS